MSETEQTDSKTPEPGGLGGACGLGSVDPQLGARDIRLLKRAAKQRWKIPELAYEIIPNEMIKIVGEKDRATGEHKHTPENRIRAARVISTLHGQNQDDEHHEDRVDRPEQAVNVNVVQNNAPVVSVSQIRQEILSDPKVIEALRMTEIEPS